MRRPLFCWGVLVFCSGVVRFLLEFPFTNGKMNGNFASSGRFPVRNPVS